MKKTNLCYCFDDSSNQYNYGDIEVYNGRRERFYLKNNSYRIYKGKYIIVDEDVLYSPIYDVVDFLNCI